MGTHAKRAILQSGSLLLAPPAPHHRGAHMREALEDYLRKRCNKGLQDAPVDALVQALEHLQIKSVWLEITPELQDWQTKREDVDELMIGDCEFEVNIQCALVNYSNMCESQFFGWKGFAPCQRSG